MLCQSMGTWHREHSIATMENLRIMPATPRPGRDGLSRMGDAQAECIRSYARILLRIVTDFAARKRSKRE
jgi:hypothetical protein